MVHPRATRNCPLRLLRQKYHIFTNNINGSPGYLHKSLMMMTNGPSSPHKYLFADSVSCHTLMKKCGTVKIGRDSVQFQCFLVQFWCGDESEALPTVSVEVHAPLSWTPQNFLDEFEENLTSHRAISLINTYYLKGFQLNYNTINTMHYKFIN